MKASSGPMCRIAINTNVDKTDVFCTKTCVLFIFLSIPFMTPQIRETVLTFISQNGLHQKLMETKHFHHLKQLVVSNGQPNQVKDLVDYLISQNW